MGGGASPLDSFCKTHGKSAALDGAITTLCAPPELDAVVLVGTVLGGLAVFLYGMERMSHLLKEVAGASMKDTLQKATGNRFLGLVAGFFVTAVLSSSSAASVLVVSFVEAGLMPFENSLGMLLGVNIGTTITMHLTTTSVMQYAMHIVALGFFGEMFSKSKVTKAQFGILNGLGLLFYGMHIMGGAMSPLKHNADFKNLMKSSVGALGIVVAAVFTVVIQSSSAATGVISQLAQQQVSGAPPPNETPSCRAPQYMPLTLCCVLYYSCSPSRRARAW